LLQCLCSISAKYQVSHLYSQNIFVFELTSVIEKESVMPDNSEIKKKEKLERKRKNPKMKKTKERKDVNSLFNQKLITTIQY